MNDSDLDWYLVTITLRNLSQRARMKLHIEATDARIAEEIVRGMWSSETFCNFETKRWDERD